MIINQFSSNKKEKKDISNLDIEVLNLLKEKKSLTFPEIAKELNIYNGNREILLNVLFRLVIGGKIKKQKTNNAFVIQGINLTTRFFL